MNSWTWIDWAIFIYIVEFIILILFMLSLLKDNNEDIKFRYYKITRKRNGYYLQLRKITNRTYKDKLMFEVGPYYRLESAKEVGETILTKMKDEHF